MKTPTKRTTRRIAASIAIVLALATSGAYAATDRTWNGGSGGSVSDPLDIYKAENWSHSASPTTSDNLKFTFSALTYLTNSVANAASTAVCNEANFNDGTSVLLGAIRSSSTFRLAQTSGKTVEVQVAEGGTLYAGGILAIGCGGAATLTVNGGTVYSAGELRVGNGSTATLTINGGTVEVVSSKTLALPSAGTGTLNMNGGTLKTQCIKKTGGTSGTLNFNGGTLQANANITSDFISSTLAAVNVLTGGGTIDANGKSVKIAKALTGEGAMTFKNSGNTTSTITLSGTGDHWAGGTTNALNTKIVASSDGAKAAVLDNGLVIDGTGVFTSGDYTVFEYSGGTLTDADLAKVSFINCVVEPVPEIVDGNSIVVHFTVQFIPKTTDTVKVWEGKTLEDIAEGTFSSRMGGGYVNDTYFRYTADSARGYNKQVKENSVIVEFQIYNNQTKCVVVEFTEDGGDIYATALGAAQVSGNYLGHVFYSETGSYNSTVATSMTANGYGVFDLHVVLPTVWTLDGDTTWNALRNGATLASDEVVRIKVTDSDAVLTVDEDVNVGQIVFVDGTGTTLKINEGVTLSAGDYSGLGYVLNNGTFDKRGDGTVEMKFDNASRGVFVVNAGKLKATNKRHEGAGTPITGDPDVTPRSTFLIDVKSGATYDVNGQTSVSACVRLAEGAHFISSADANLTYGQTMQLILAGDADVTANGNFGLYTEGARLDLGLHTLEVNAASGKQFMLGRTTITGGGTISVVSGTLAVRNNYDVIGEDCTLSIGSGGKLFIAPSANKLSVKNFVNGGAIDSGTAGTLEVTGTLTPGSAAIPKLTLASGATVKATGTAQMVSTTFTASGACSIDASEITRAQLDEAADERIPVLIVPTAYNPSGVTWNVTGAPFDGCRAKWVNDDGGETKTLYLCKPTGLMVIIR